MIVYRKTIIILLLSVYGLSCAYYNTFFNAERYYEDAEKEILAVEDRTELTKKTMDGLDKTIEKSSTVLEKYPNSRLRDNALFLLGKALFYRGEYLKAIESFNTIILEETESPFVLDSKLWLVRCKWKTGEQDTALHELQKLLSDVKSVSGRDSKKSYLALGNEIAGDIYLEQGNADSAIFYYSESTKYLKGGGQRSQLYFEIAELAFNNSFLNVAMDYYQNVIRYSRIPKHIETAHLQVVKILRLEKRWEETTSEIQNLLSEDKFIKIRPQLYLELAKLYEMQSRINEAINRYELITQEYQRTETSAEAYFHLGRLTLETGKGYEEARKYYEGVVKDKRTSMYAPSASTKVKEINAILKAIKIIDELDQTLATVIDASFDTVSVENSADSTQISNSDSDKDSTAILIELGEELYSYGELLSFHFNQPDSGIKIFERLVNEMPSSNRRAQALFSLAYLYRERNEPERAEHYVKQLVSEYPISEYAEKVSISSGLEFFDEAEEVLKEAETFSQDNPEEALVIYQAILKNYPSSRFIPLALLAIANTYDYELNDLDKSLQYYGQLIEDFPDSEQAQYVEYRYQQLRELKDSESERED